MVLSSYTRSRDWNRNLDSSKNGNILTWQEKQFGAKSPEENVNGNVGNKDQPKNLMPVSKPITLPELFVALVMHVCRKWMFLKVEIKIAIYCFILMVGSALCDFFPLPRTYFSQKTNLFYKYFATVGWFLCLSMLGSFVMTATFVYCCGKRSRIRDHMSRLVIAAAVWYLSTCLFAYVERATGSCVPRKLQSELAANAVKFGTVESCVQAGHRWMGFLVAAIPFMLIYSNLTISEEAKCFRGWERIGTLIRIHKFDDNSPLDKLADEELEQLKESYEKYTSLLKGLFVGLTFTSVLWDFLLVCSVLFADSLPQKLAAGAMAVMLWFLNYRIFFARIVLPGQGLFKYYLPKTNETTSVRRRSSLLDKKRLGKA